MVLGFRVKGIFDRNGLSSQALGLGFGVGFRALVR